PSVLTHWVTATNFLGLRLIPRSRAYLGAITTKSGGIWDILFEKSPESSMPSWLHTFASACLSERCCSPGTASYLADSQGLTRYLVYPEGLPIPMDHWSIPSYRFHGAHMECTTRAKPS